MCARFLLLSVTFACVLATTGCLGVGADPGWRFFAAEDPSPDGFQEVGGSRTWETSANITTRFAAKAYWERPIPAGRALHLSWTSDRPIEPTLEIRAPNGTETWEIYTLVCEEGQKQAKLEGRFRANITASATTCTMELTTETVLVAPRNGIALVWSVPARPDRAGQPDPVMVQFDAS